MSSDLVASLDDAQMQTPVPACPAWRVHDLLCHLVGLPGDVNAGRIEGAGTDPWTASSGRRALRQHSRRAARRVGAERRPSVRGDHPHDRPAAPVFDLVVHEQDLRGAIGVPGARDSAGVRWLVDIALARLASEIDEANLPALEIAMEDEGFVAGSGDVVDRWDIERFELFRSFAGRRSANQLRASGCPLVYVQKVRIPPDGAERRHRARVSDAQTTRGTTTGPLYRALTCSRRSASRC